MKVLSLHDQLTLVCRRVINLQNQDPLSKTRGCFDRRFWAWKLCDYPEATYQRLILPLCWYMHEEKDPFLKQKAYVAVRLGLEYALKIQHSDGSFDQAYPYERSYGATAFLLHPLLKAYRSISAQYEPFERQSFEKRLYQSAAYLVKYKEFHSFIANHLAGSALALLEAGLFFNDSRFSHSAQELVDMLISNQSSEGWYLEYDGADPGYQTLCVHYLAQFYDLNQDPGLLLSLQNAIHFLSHFAHPDGSFGGEYGSRRTAIYYPGGVALLAKTIPEAASLHDFMLRSIEAGKTVSALEIDDGNLAPLLSSAILTEQENGELASPLEALPCQLAQIDRDFPQAGISIRGNGRYYAVVGISNGGVCKFFAQKDKQLIYNDCGLVLQKKNGKMLTSQHTHLKNSSVSLNKNTISFSVLCSPYARLEQRPATFLLLRIANLTFMRIRFLNELIKKMLVNVLISPSSGGKITRTVKIDFKENAIQIHESLSGRELHNILSITRASAFTAIHMASARYPLSTSWIGGQEELPFHETRGVLSREEEFSFSGKKK